MSASRTIKARITNPEKSQGLTYTPDVLADFMAERLIAQLEQQLHGDAYPERLRVLDPAVGDGALLYAVARGIEARWPNTELVLTGVDLDADALDAARTRCEPLAPLHLIHGDFFHHYDDEVCDADLVIANPPYVRAQSIDGRRARRLVRLFGLKGHKDLSHAFMLAILDVLARNPGALATTVLPNSVLLTAAASSFRDRVLAEHTLHEIWDLGDSRLFDAAVLPVVLCIGHRDPWALAQPDLKGTTFLSAYSRESPPEPPLISDVLQGLCALHQDEQRATSWTRASNKARCFELRKGQLARSEPHGGWVLRDGAQRALLEAIMARRWKTLSQIGRIRVGVKSCADAVFLRDSWEGVGVEAELLEPLMTHHVARPFRHEPVTRELLYPHVVDAQGARALVDLDDYPGARAYLESHRSTLEKRKYIAAVGRQWYELWVPQDPGRWHKDKVVWRDIATRPTFWLDQSGCVVNGDCYWLDLEDGQREELLWLVLALGNSEFAHHFYQATAGHRIYAGRRRYMARYLEHFPLPRPDTEQARELIELARAIHDEPETFSAQREQLDALVWAIWGVGRDVFESL